MKKTILFSIFYLVFMGHTLAQVNRYRTEFENSQGLRTSDYAEVIRFYKLLAADFAQCQITEVGSTDIGEPLHLVLFSASGNFDLKQLRAQGKRVWMINNGIHPGEPDGIDASMMFLRQLLTDKKVQEKYKDIVIGIIPIYNVGGALNLSGYSRANQNGPSVYGFRGNARNLDLNRDFIKQESKNARAFASIFQMLDPDLFLDTHVSNGADYQYTMTLLNTQEDKLGGLLGPYMRDKLNPSLFEKMKSKGHEMTPYVSVYNSTPDQGWNQFMDWPRYSSGYSTLWQSFGFMAETHMLKPFPQRVSATLALMESMGEYLIEKGQEIIELRQQERKRLQEASIFPINWSIDKSRSTPISFKGYAGETRKSEITGADRLFYDRNKPWEKEVPFFNFYTNSKITDKPKAYVIPKGWQHVIEVLQANGVEMREVGRDTTIFVEIYKIESFETYQQPFEGHYLHFNTVVKKQRKTLYFDKGDWIIPTQQKALRYLIETLEPEAPDSFFNWNFFDTILQQKEGYSAYVFEDLALKILSENPGLKKEFEQKKSRDKDFASNPRAQLDFIYKGSPYYEPIHMTYPVYRILN